MKNIVLIFSVILFTLLSCKKPSSLADVWISHPDEGLLFVQQEPIQILFDEDDKADIEISENIEFQEMEGFGYTLTQGSAKHLLGMDAKARTELLKELFDPQIGIGVSFLRLSIAASDLNDYPFSYHDVEDGQEDPSLDKFDLGPDRLDVLPILKEILSIQPQIKLMASPWSPPAWMKDNKDTRGGQLLPENYSAYALYFLKYIQYMAAEGINIDAITIQNEPLHPGNDPSLLMLPEEQAEFIKNHLGPTFEAAGISTKILIYDHNADKPEYPISILNDAEAKKYIHGSAFHLYAGKIDALSEVHKAHPDKNIYFTEQWVGAPGDMKGDLIWHVKNLLIGGPKNWAKTVLEWNLSSNPELTPYTERGGCKNCLGAVTISGNEVSRNPAYYVIAHASKFVRPGSIRIDSSEMKGLPNVAFRTPEGKIVLIMLNETGEEKKVKIRLKDQIGIYTMPPSAVATLVI